VTASRSAHRAHGPTVAEISRLADLPGPESLVRVVALDGPAGTGKSSVARHLAAALGWRFVDTGATYRAATLVTLRAGIDPADSKEVAALVADSQVALETDPAIPSTWLAGEDVSAAIRSAEVTSQVSVVSGIPEVRSLMIAVQRHAMGTEGSVVEGRDIATVVAPLAGLKVYLDARPEVRAQRRARELSAPVADGRPGATTTGSPGPGAAVGVGPGLQAAGQGAAEPIPVISEEAHEESERTAQVARELARRDGLDSQTNKLEVSEGAVHLDTSDLTLVQVVAVLLHLVREAGLAPDQAGS
jgi:cytidylate kinase